MGTVGVIIATLTLLVLWDLMKYGTGSGVYVRSDDQWKTDERGNGGEW